MKHPLSQWVEHASRHGCIKKTNGYFFDVEIYADFVVKTPKPEQAGRLRNMHGAVSIEETLEHIASCQEELSRMIPSVLPAYRVGAQIFMPRARGVRCTEIPEKWTWIKDIVKKDVEKINKSGYMAMDLGQENVFWDEERKSIYMIDFHAIKKAGD